MESIAEEATRITCEDRMSEYGHPKDNLANIASLWSAYLNNKLDISDDYYHSFSLDAKDIALLMSLFKVGREQTFHKRDNLVDAMGYIINAHQIEVAK
jgi:hypothetical protein